MDHLLSASADVSRVLPTSTFAATKDLTSIYYNAKSMRTQEK